MQRKYLWLIWLALLCGCQASSQATQPQEHRLLRRAVRVQVAEIAGGIKVDWEDGYQWLSDRNLLLIRSLPFSDAQVRPLTFFRCNTAKRTEMLLAAVNAQLSTTRDQLCGWQLSPDGKHLLVHVRDGTASLRLDGSDYRWCKDAGRFAKVYWLADSRHWLHAFGGVAGNMGGHFLDYPQLTVYGLASLKPVSRLANSANNPIYPAEDAQQHTIAVAGFGSDLLTFNIAGHAGEFPTAKRAVLLRRSLRSPGRASVISVLRLPEPGRVVEAAFSPRGGYVSYILLSHHRASLAGRRRKQAARHTGVQPRLSIWVSRLDGSKRQEE